jgi:excisionase family DNA binding protein
VSSEAPTSTTLPATGHEEAEVHPRVPACAAQADGGRSLSNQLTLTPEMQAMVKAIVEMVLDGLKSGCRLPVPVDSQDPARPASAAGEWLSARDAAEHLGMNLKAFYSAVERGQVPASRIGRRLRFSRNGLDQLLLRRSRRAVQQPPRVPSPRKPERW